MTEVEETKLRTCPFCGGEATVIESGNMARVLINNDIYLAPCYYCQCKSCGAKTKEHENIEFAFRAWNRRNNEWLIL